MKIQLGQYKKFGFKIPNVIVNDDEINDFFNKIRERYKIDTEKKGAVKKGDYIAIDYDAYYDREITPELTDDVVRNFEIDGVNTIKELKEYAKDNLYYEKMMVESTNTINKIMRKIIVSSTVQLKDEEVNFLKDEIFEDFIKQLEKRNANLQIYLSYANKTEEEVLKQCELEAETYLTEKAIVEKIAEIESIALNDEEMEKYKNTEEQDFFNQLLYKKVINFLLKENTTIIKNSPLLYLFITVGNFLLFTKLSHVILLISIVCMLV